MILTRPDRPGWWLAWSSSSEERSLPPRLVLVRWVESGEFYSVSDRWFYLGVDPGNPTGRTEEQTWSR